MKHYSECRKCGYGWEADTESPVRCANPRCRSPYWKSEPVVYVAKWSDGQFKIGCTNNILSRYGSKRGRERVICMIPVPTGINMYEAEKRIHSLFSGKRTDYQSELFNLDEQDIAVLHELANGKMLP